MEHFFSVFTNVYRPYVYHINKILEPYDLFASQYKVFKDIHNHQPTTLVDISQRLFIEKPSTRKIVKKLIEQGFIQAVTNEEDKRQKFLTLTSEGKTTYNKAFEEVQKFNNSVFQSLKISEEEVLKNVELMESIRAYFVREGKE